MTYRIRSTRRSKYTQAHARGHGSAKSVHFFDEKSQIRATFLVIFLAIFGHLLPLFYVVQRVAVFVVFSTKFGSGPMVLLWLFGMRRC